eukprot:COSAG01_NODE_7814_length_3046_cov_1.184255_4_plen_62_part_00
MLCWRSLRGVLVSGESRVRCPSTAVDPKLEDNRQDPGLAISTAVPGLYDSLRRLRLYCRDP